MEIMKKQISRTSVITGAFMVLWLGVCAFNTPSTPELPAYKLKTVVIDAGHGGHDEVGYLLWDKEREQVIRSVVFGRGIAIQAGGNAKLHDKMFHFKAKAGDSCYGILQNKYLLERAELKSFESTFKFNPDGTFTHSSDIVLKLAALGGKLMHHTDKNTLHLVKRYHPSIQYL